MIAGLLAYILGIVTLPVLLLVAKAAVMWWRWARLNLFRRVPIPGFTVMPLTRSVERLKSVGWKIKLVGLTGKRYGVGFVYGVPPVFECESVSCQAQFKTEAECIAHEKAERHGDYRYQEANDG